MNRSEILHLTEACPRDHCNPRLCPLHEVRKLNPTGRMNWVHMLSLEDLEYISLYCEICLQCKSSGADYFTTPATDYASSPSVS